MARTPGPTDSDPHRVRAPHGVRHNVRTSVVDARVAEGRVQQPDHRDRVATDVHRHVHRNLDDIAGYDTRGVRGDTLGARVGDGQARTRENQTTGGSRGSDDLLDHYSSLLAKRSKPRT